MKRDHHYMNVLNVECLRVVRMFAHFVGSVKELYNGLREEVIKALLLYLLNPRL